MDQTPPRPTRDAPPGPDAFHGHDNDGGPHGNDGPHGPYGHRGHHREGGVWRRRLVREPEGRKVAGVCSGLADHLGVDVTVMRVCAVVLALLTPKALLAYVVASVLMPEREPDQPRRPARRVHLGAVPHPVIVIGAVIAVAAIVDDAWWLEPFPAAVALVGVGVWLIVQGTGGDDRPAAPRPPTTVRPDDGTAAPVDAPTDPPMAGDVDGPASAPPLAHPMAASPWHVSVSRHSNADSAGDTTLTNATTGPAPIDAESIDAESTEAAGPSGEFPPPASPWWSGNPGGPTAPAADPPTRGRSRRCRSTRLGGTVLALLLVGAGVLWLLDSMDAIDIPVRDALALALVGAGVGLLVAAWRGRAPALIPLAAVLVGVLVVDEVVDVPMDAGIGDRTVVVDRAAELDLHHELYAGDLTVDLRDAPLPARGAPLVEASVGMGTLRVIVPRDAQVAVTATNGAGEVVSPAGPEANESGIRLDESFTLDGDGPRVDLDLSVATGRVEVVRG